MITIMLMARPVSRLQRLEERRKLKKAIWLILFTIVIISGLVVGGLPLLTKFFLFLSSSKNPSNITDKNDFIPPSPPQLWIEYEATNSAVLNLQGSAEPGSTIYLVHNSDTKEAVKAEDNGLFRYENLTLKEGNNIFSAVSMDSAGNKSQASSEVTINYSTKAPTLKIESPSNNQTFSGKDQIVTIKGTTDPGSRLVINERVIIVSQNGSFSYQLHLSQGENMILITSTNHNGNQTKQELILNYKS